MNLSQMDKEAILKTKAFIDELMKSPVILGKYEKLTTSFKGNVNENGEEDGMERKLLHMPESLKNVAVRDEQANNPLEKILKKPKNVTEERCRPIQLQQREQQKVRDISPSATPLELDQSIKDVLDPDNTPESVNVMEIKRDETESQEDVCLKPAELIKQEKFPHTSIEKDNEDEGNTFSEPKKESSIGYQVLRPNPCENDVPKPTRAKSSSLKKPPLSLEERKWCVEMYKIHKGRKEIGGWFTYLEEMFSLQFPGRSVPCRKTIRDNVMKMEKFNSVEDRKKSGRKPKPYSNVCDMCGYVGNGKAAMRNHFRRIHGELKPCDECGEMVRNLVDHKRSRHTPDNEKKFRCSLCDKGFTCRQKLNEHELIHGDLRPFPCQYNCGYACKFVGNLRKHEIRCAKRPF